MSRLLREPLYITGDKLEAGLHQLYVIRHQIAHVYGIRDYEYLKMKIYKLPIMALKKQLLCSCA